MRAAALLRPAISVALATGCGSSAHGIGPTDGGTNEGMSSSPEASTLSPPTTLVALGFPAYFWLRRRAVAA
jgi:hypothetical protein